MEEQKTGLFASGLIWFGAAVSIAEILTGALLAPLGFGRGILAILIGHAIGCALLFAAGLIGSRTGLGAMDTVKLSFGSRGGLLFAALNVLQLVGWTAVMAASGAGAAATALPTVGSWVWVLVIGALIAVWIMAGIKNIEKLNIAAMAALFVLTIVLCVTVFGGSAQPAASAETLTFGAAVELSVAMPLSWLPLISDYTRRAKRKVAAPAVSAMVYFLASSWMYVIGLGAAIFTGESDIASIMVKAGLGAVGLVIIILSTVTTTFLDVYSAGVSMVSISGRLNEKYCALAVCAVGTAAALLPISAGFESFLYLIGSVFAPMIAVQISDAFIVRRERNVKYDVAALIIWLAGFALYRVFMRIDTPVGNTLPVMAIVCAARAIQTKISIKKA